MNWNQISIEKYIALYNLSSQELEELDMFIHQLSIIFDLSIEQVENLEMDKVNEYKEQMLFLQSEPDQTKLKEEICINNVKYFLNKNLDSLRLGEFVDLESISKQDVILNLHRVLAILYKKGNELEYNPASSDKKADLFYKNMDIETAFSALLFFLSFRTELLTNRYNGLFNAGFNSDGIEADEERPDETPQRRSIGSSKKDTEEKTQSEFTWLLIIDTLACGNVLNYDAVCKLNIITALNKLSLDKSIPNSYTNLVLSSGRGFIA